MKNTKFGSAVKTESKGETTATRVRAPHFKYRCLYYNKQSGVCKMDIGKCVSADSGGNCNL